jgi:hypothetical protein
MEESDVWGVGKQPGNTKHQATGSIRQMTDWRFALTIIGEIAHCISACCPSKRVFGPGNSSKAHGLVPTFTQVYCLPPKYCACIIWKRDLSLLAQTRCSP